MPYAAINPYNETRLKEFAEIADDTLESKISRAHEAQMLWKRTKLSNRAWQLNRLAEVLDRRAPELAATITLEMGKPIAQAVAEVQKCARTARWYADTAENSLKRHKHNADGFESFTRWDPLGIVYAIMPWNYPFWQALRCAIPAITAGNAILLKHAENVPQCAQLLEDLFEEAGYPRYIYQNMFISRDQSAVIIANEHVQGISLTGSETAGSQVGELAGKNIKKCVMELGGSDAFIVLPDADIKKAVETGIKSRFGNNGQSCIAAKRFILHSQIAKDFIDQFTAQVREMKIGDPIDSKTTLGPVAREDLMKTVLDQVDQTLASGARALTGGIRYGAKGWLIEPTVLIEIEKNTPAYTEEIFGPVASMFVVDSADAAIELANDHRYGLGASIWSNNIDLARKMARYIAAGNVFINSQVASHPALPFGGIKKSGYGRELSEMGLHEFCNAKTVNIG